MMCARDAPKPPPVKIASFETADVRFPTSRTLAGSDAMHPDPDYSVAYVTLRTDTGAEGYGFTFTIGRGNDVCVRAIELVASMLVGLELTDAATDLASLPKMLVGDAQLRWLGPEKGAIHLGTAAVVNALWDLWARLEGKPLWKFLADMEPIDVVRCVDWRYLTDVLTPQAGLEMLTSRRAGRDQREATLLADGYPAYATSPGWLGYRDDKLLRLTEEALAAGFTQIKLKVGQDVERDVHRLELARATVGPSVGIAIDANQCWEVDEAIHAVRRYAEYDLAWIEEPTSPDDIAGHAAIARAVSPLRVATGEHCHNRVMFKQFLAAGAMQVCQIDACRVAGVNENLAILLLAARHEVAVVPHAGGVGLSEVVQHLAMFDYVALGAPRADARDSLDGRLIEWADHLHEHFAVPATVSHGRYRTPTAPGSGAEMLQESIDEYTWRAGSAPRTNGIRAGTDPTDRATVAATTETG